MHVKTTGWIGLGISPGRIVFQIDDYSLQIFDHSLAGGMTGADIGVGWIDNVGTLYFQDRYAFNFSKPVIDNTTMDWIGLQGREENGWTAIQFKRLLEICDYMDLSIKSGTNIVIFAYGISDPDQHQSIGDISYHDTRRGTRMIPLRSYSDPPSENKFHGLDSFDFRLNNYLLPSTDTTYYCKVFKVPPRFPTKRHVIGYQILVNPSSKDIVHHMTTYECRADAKFDDSKLPEGVCDDHIQQFDPCLSNMANGWAVGGEHIVEYPQEAGYPIGSDYPVKYYMIQIHFDNPHLESDRRDSSGIRFYVGEELRQCDIGYLTLGTESNPSGIVIPPKASEFAIDAFCTPKATEKIPESGKSVWTKLIRKDTAVQYLFNAESYNFNYQFLNNLPKPIKLYRGDAFVTQCVYNTMNRKDASLGGQKTIDEMCLQTFAYYPRMNDLFVCVSSLSPTAWLTMTNSSSLANIETFKQWLNSIQWTPEVVAKWQQFYKNSSRLVRIIGGQTFETISLDILPTYQDLITTTSCNTANHRTETFIFLSFIPLLMSTWCYLVEFLNTII
ncbi:unnamed protein product [Rotaria sordida]|uniref:DOMON domain-containing protein n=1 Tax=Rotaria sordida TaxID=392033 RepID=A0A814J8W9_9BILA|nr:unnamed protein product [Rotaria sordida]